MKKISQLSSHAGKSCFNKKKKGGPALVGPIPYSLSNFFFPFSYFSRQYQAGYHLAGESRFPYWLLCLGGWLCHPDPFQRLCSYLLITLLLTEFLTILAFWHSWFLKAFFWDFWSIWCPCLISGTLWILPVFGSCVLIFLSFGFCVLLDFCFSIPDRPPPSR